MKIYQLLDKNGSLYNPTCGFFVGNLFISCGHGVEDMKSYEITSEDRKERYLLESQLICKFEKGNALGFDLSVFRFPKKMNNLCLACNFPKERAVLTSKSLKDVKEGIKTIVCDVVVGHGKYFSDGNYFGGYISDLDSNVGSSGSPVFKDNVVYGITHAGCCDEKGQKIDPELPANFRNYLSSKAILEELKRMNIPNLSDLSASSD